MFTGIIESAGIIQSTEEKGSNRTFRIASPISSELKIDQSVSHNGVCLTVEGTDGGIHRVTAVQETLEKTDLGDWKTGDVINMERCLVMNGRLDGHIVQGHVDATGEVTGKKDLQGSWEFVISFPSNFRQLVIEKGSISLNGISLTIFNVTDESFTVAIIPYTYHHTNMRSLSVGDKVNLEFDMIGKYVNRMMQFRNQD